MTELIPKVNAFSSTWVEAMLSVLWQSSPLAIAVAVVLFAWRNLSPSLKCWVWRIVAVKMLVMLFWTVNVPLPRQFAIAPAAVTRTPLVSTSSRAVVAAQRFGTTIGRQRMADIAHETSMSPIALELAADSTSIQFTWSSWLCAAWMSVIGVQLWRLCWQRIGLHRLLADSRPADEAIRRIVVNACGQLGLTRVPPARVTDAEVSPFVCRITRPVLVLPGSMTVTYDPSQLRQIVLHELAHVRRFDLLWCWIMHLVRMVYWFHPIAHWVAFRESLERELACDELAMSHTGTTAAEYARTLIEAANRLAQPVVVRAIAATRLDGGYSVRRQHSITNTHIAASTDEVLS